MPRQYNAVKDKTKFPRKDQPSKSIRSSSIDTSVGIVDLHFHGAFGIDLMTAEAADLCFLSEKLWESGIAGFCPTTLSSTPQQLLAAVSRLGIWIRSRTAPGALPLGIHLEGPYLNPEAAGAHLPGVLRRLDFKELDRLWCASQETLKILTLAPELLAPGQIKKLVQWSRPRKIKLSIGHSQATETQAKAAFEAGFSGVTHAWNALSFHHREPGVLGAALGSSNHVEIIADEIHVHPTLVNWALKLHPERTCFVSDCVPAAGTRRGTTHRFGDLKIHATQEGCCRLPNGALAGGGLLLSQMYARWIQREAKRTGHPVRKLLLQTRKHVTDAPLEAIQAQIPNRQIRWTLTPQGTLRLVPLPKIKG